jgi:hypothetical protein
MEARKHCNWEVAARKENGESAKRSERHSSGDPHNDGRMDGMISFTEGKEIGVMKEVS